MKDKKLFVAILLLISLSYFFMFSFIKFSLLTSSLAVVIIYYIIIFNKKYDIECILILLVFNHVLIPTINQINTNYWVEINVLIKYIPLLIIIIKQIICHHKIEHKKFLIMLIYLLFSIIQSSYDFSISMEVVKDRLFPLAYIILIIAFTQEEKYNCKNIVKILRLALILSLCTYFIPNYMDTVKDLIESGFISNVPVYNIEYMQGGNFLRNQGVVFDPRLLGCIAYLLFFISVKDKNKFDLFLSLVVSITCFSRGNVVVLITIIVGKFILMRKVPSYKSIIATSIIIVLSIPICFLIYNSIGDKYNNYFKTFNIFSSERNVINQRQELSDMALVEAKKHILVGNGVGWVSSKNNIVFGYTYYNVVSDAYYSILLAEIGIVGMILFFAQLIKLFNCKNALNFSFLIGFCIQLIGTDVPDSSSDFIYIGILIYIFTGCYMQNKKNIE